MNVPFLPEIITFCRKHALELAAALLAALLAVGGYSGWRYYQYRQSAEYAFAAFKEALRPSSPQRLAELVDFAFFSRRLAKDIAQSYPFLKQGPEQLETLSAMIQTALLKQARSKEEPPKEETDLQVRLKTPLHALPQDFLSQVAASLILQTADEDTALLAARVRHPLLDEEFSLMLRMDNSPEGWKVRHLVNGGEMARRYRAAQMERMLAQRQQTLDKNILAEKRMAQSFPLRSCEGSAGLLSDGKTLLLVVNVKAQNTGSVTVNNMNLSAKFLTPDGQDLLHRYLNAVQPTHPGELFERNWTIELDSQSPLGRSVLGAERLRCEAAWKTLGLANGEVLHVADTPALREEFQ